MRYGWFGGMGVLGLFSGGIVGFAWAIGITMVVRWWFESLGPATPTEAQLKSEISYLEDQIRYIPRRVDEEERSFSSQTTEYLPTSAEPKLAEMCELECPTCRVIFQIKDSPDIKSNTQCSNCVLDRWRAERV